MTPIATAVAAIYMALTPTATPTPVSQAVFTHITIPPAFLGVSITPWVSNTVLLVRWDEENPKAMPVTPVSSDYEGAALWCRITTKADRPGKPAGRYKGYDIIRTGFYAQPIRAAKKDESAWCVRFAAWREEDDISR